MLNERGIGALGRNNAMPVSKRFAENTPSQWTDQTTRGRPRSVATRWLRALFFALVLIAAMAVSGVSASAVQAAVPDAQQQVIWQHTCEDVAQGTVSPQEALVCVHTGFPQWVDHVLAVVQRICESPLGGTFVYRSEYPTELAACFL
jgi:hypothetical protein